MEDLLQIHIGPFRTMKSDPAKLTFLVLMEWERRGSVKTDSHVNLNHLLLPTAHLEQWCVAQGIQNLKSPRKMNAAAKL
jgi:hypothetical protein